MQLLLIIIIIIHLYIHLLQSSSLGLFCTLVKKKTSCHEKIQTIGSTSIELCCFAIFFI